VVRLAGTATLFVATGAEGAQRIRAVQAAPLPREALSDLLSAADEVVALEHNVVVAAAAATFRSFTELAVAVRKSAQDAGMRCGCHSWTFRRQGYALRACACAPATEGHTLSLHHCADGRMPLKAELVQELTARMLDIQAEMGLFCKETGGASPGTDG
jgi:hypothetical protein